MSKRIIALILAVVTIMGLFVLPGSAASTLEDAMAEVNVYAKNDDLNWLTMNGSVKTQHYTYYNYTSAQTGQTMEIPAYCVDPRLYGVPALVPEGTAIKYSANSTVSDPKVCGIIANGYPHMSLDTLGLHSVEEAYYATKTALWIYLLGNWSISGLDINPNLTGTDKEAAQRVLEATKNIYWRGMKWDNLISPKLTATPDKDTAYAVTINGERYYQQVFTISSETWSVEAVKVSLANGAPSGAKIMDMNNQEISQIVLGTTSVNGQGYQGQIKVVYPADSISGQTGTVQLNLTSVVSQYAIYYARSLETDKYGNIQDYMLDTDPNTPISASAISRYSVTDGDVSDDTPSTVETGIKITKLETGTNIPLEGAVFEILYPNGDVVGSFSTDKDGIIEVPLTITGNYTVTELIAPKNHSLSEKTTQNVTVVHGQTAELTFWNKPVGGLRVEKRSDTGEGLKGVTVQIKNLETGTTQSGQTGAGGILEFNDLPPGGYEVREIAGIDGYVADTETIQTATVISGETSTVTFINKELPGLRIIKYDRTTLETMEDVAFEIWRDGTLLGQYTTDQMGEILLLDATPGTYLVQEIQSDNSHIVDTTPQQIELAAGDGVKQLVFYNDKRPGIHLIKVDSANLSQPIANAKFKIELVGGTYSKEFVTDANGEVDLTDLEPGAYTVTELEAPDGYLIDEATRIIQINGNENAEFVFTNTKKPSMKIVKLDSYDSGALAGAAFRIAKIEDGSHYLDRVTDTNGEINISDLEPGVYSVQEIKAPEGYVVDATEYHVELFAGKASELVVSNDRKPNLEIVKTDAITGDAVQGVTFTVKAVDSSTLTTVTSDKDGKCLVENLDPGVYEVWEKSVPDDYLINEEHQLITLVANRTGTVQFQNYPKPSLTINKVDSITGDPIKGAKFSVTYASNNTFTGEINDLGIYYTDENGQINLTKLQDGWYKVTELEPAAGYAIKDPATQEIYIKAGTSRTLTFENTPLSALVVYKYDSATGKPISDVEFFVTTSDGTVVGDSNGKFVTDSSGTFTISGITPGTTLVVKETRAKDGYVLDDTPQTAKIQAGQTVTLEFRNQPKGNLIINKLDSVTKKPLAGVQFKITYADGSYVDAEGGKLSSNGLYTTDSNGQIILSGITGTVVVTEVQTLEGYTIDENTRIQTVIVNTNDTQTLTCYNTPIGGVELIKVDSADKTKRIANTTFEIRKMDDALVDTVTTDSNGRVFLSLDAGSYYAVEIEAAKGYKLDSTPHYFTVKDGKTTSVTVANKAVSGILIHKTDSTTGKGIYGVTFLLYDSSNTPIGQYTSDNSGYVYIEDLDAGRYYLRELENEGYVLDTQKKTVYVKSGKTTEVAWKNTPITGQIQLTKTSADYNNTNGWAAGTPIPGTEYEIYNKAGNLVDTIRTDKNGVASSKALPLGRYKLIESKAADYYALDKTPIEVEIEFSGQIVRVAATNQSIRTNVSITKTGYTEVMPGQTARYTFSGIGNNSTVSLTNFYWRDTLPTEAVRLSQIITGTYNTPGNYKIVYRTNLSGSEYRTLADNLSTQKNYTLIATPVALKLASNEYVTEVMMVFGTVPAGFKQVESPKIDCTVVSWAVNGLQFVNQADVGGTYNSEWIQATSRWVTKVYAPSRTLPRTGY